MRISYASVNAKTKGYLQFNNYLKIHNMKGFEHVEKE